MSFDEEVTLHRATLGHVKQFFTLLANSKKLTGLARLSEGECCFELTIQSRLEAKLCRCRARSSKPVCGSFGVTGGFDSL